MSDLLGQCKFIRAFQLYLDKGSKALDMLNHCLEGVCLNSSIKDLSISCLDAGQCLSPMALSVSNVLHE